MFKCLASRESPAEPNGPYFHFIAGNVYGPETVPAGTAFLEARAVREGWGEALPEPKSEFE